MLSIVPRLSDVLLFPGEMDFFPDDHMVPFCQPFKKMANEMAREISRFPKEFPVSATFDKPIIKDGKFQAKFDVRGFDPEGIELKVDGDMLHLKVKKEKKTDDNNYEYCEYQRKFNIPKEVIQDQLKCVINDQGRLEIEAPVKMIEEPKRNGKQIPIQFM